MSITSQGSQEGRKYDVWRAFSFLLKLQSKQIHFSYLANGKHYLSLIKQYDCKYLPAKYNAFT